MMNVCKAAFGGMLCLMAGLVVGLSAKPAAAQYGPLLSGTGPINRSMGGAATGSPLSASGALMWNPASLSGLNRSELDIGAELLFPYTSLSSSIPAFGLSGTTANEDAVFPLPTIALAYRPDNSPFTYGLGMFAVAGFGLNYPASLTNPILLPQPLGGFGPLFSQYQVLQITPALVYEVNEQLSVSVSPLVNIGMAQLDPALFANVGATGYPSGTHSSSSWGAGFSLGAFYKAGNWDFGASYKSKQWFQQYEFNTIDPNTFVPLTVGLSLDLPSIVSVGASYKGIDRWLLAADVRYIDFSNTGAFVDSGFTPLLPGPTGAALRGLGMQDIVVVALGAQYQMTDALSVRAGYSWSENPIPSSQTSANAASPLIIQHSLSAGASYQVTDAFSLSLAYMHCFENSISGPIVSPFPLPPGSNTITSTAAVDSLMIGATVKFGCPKCGVHAAH